MEDPIPISPGTGEQFKDTVINDNFRRAFQQLRTTILKDEDGVDRYISGKLPDGTYGTKVSKPGVNVLDAADSDLIYKNDFDKTTYFDDSGNIHTIVGRFEDSGGNALYGTVTYDSSGTPRVFRGVDTNGNMLQKASKSDNSVLNSMGTALIYKDDFSTQTFYDDTDDRILLGELPDGTYGLAISKPGESVSDAFS